MHLEESKLHPQTPWFFQEPKTLVKQHQDSYKLSNDSWMAPSFSAAEVEVWGSCNRWLAWFELSGVAGTSG